MKHSTLAAGLFLLVSARVCAAELQGQAYQQVSDLASGQAAPKMYDGAGSLAVLEQMSVPSAAGSLAPASVSAAALQAPSRPAIEAVPIPQGMEIAVLRSAPARGPRAPARNYGAPLGALIGMAAGLSIGVGLSKALA
jgi:hypothetical protein